MSAMILLLCALVVAGVGIGADARFLGDDAIPIDENITLQKRYDNARFTFFDTGLGACGGVNQASDFIVALNSPQYGNGEHCYEEIQITYNGKTAQAQVVDECPGCPWGGLDLSRGLFDHFESEDKGVIYGSWAFVDGQKTQQTTKSPSTHTDLKQTSITTSMSPPTDTSTATSTTSDVAHETPSATAGPGSNTEGLSQLNEAMRSVLEVVVIAALTPLE